MTKACDIKGEQKVFSLHLNQATSCCKAHPVSLSNFDSMSSLRQHWQDEKLALSQGKELPGCQHCWNHERQGIKSFRQQFLNSDQIINTIELQIDNICNQVCSYCSPKFSSSWEQSIIDQGMFQNISASAKRNLEVSNIKPDHHQWLERIQDYINTCNDNSVDLKLLGGEPLMQKRNLEQLLAVNQAKIRRLLINTNLNPPSSKFLHWVLETFPKHKLTFDISLDTVPEYNAIPRAGFDILRFEENLNLLKQYKIDFCFLSVISVLNIFTLSKYQQWLVDNNYKATFFRLNNPDCLDPSFLPQDTKNVLLNQNLPILAQQSLMYSPDSVDLKQFEQYNYLTQYFQRTDTKITDPEFSAYWTWLTQKFQ